MTLANNDIGLQAEGEPVDEPWCGTPGGYSNHHHRCWRCREAWALKCRPAVRRYRAKNRERLNDANRERRAAEARALLAQAGDAL